MLLHLYCVCTHSMLNNRDTLLLYSSSIRSGIRTWWRYDVFMIKGHDFRLTYTRTLV